MERNPRAMDGRAIKENRFYHTGIKVEHGTVAQKINVDLLKISSNV